MHWALGLSLAGILAYSVLAILILAGARPDIGDGAGWVAAKAGLSLLYALVAAPLLLRLAKPGVGTGVWWPLLGLLLAGCVAVSALALAGTAAPDRVFAFTGGGYPHCTTVIPVLAAPAAAALFLWLRRQAPTKPALAGMAAGIVAGALAAMAYALTCPVDSAAFVAAWYPASIAICAGFGAVAGVFALRW
jgi:hypothetical protein